MSHFAFLFLYELLLDVLYCYVLYCFHCILSSFLLFCSFCFLLLSAIFLCFCTVHLSSSIWWAFIGTVVFLFLCMCWLLNSNCCFCKAFCWFHHGAYVCAHSLVAIVSHFVFLFLYQLLLDVLDCYVLYCFLCIFFCSFWLFCVSFSFLLRIIIDVLLIGKTMFFFQLFLSLMCCHLLSVHELLLSQNANVQYPCHPLSSHCQDLYLREPQIPCPAAVPPSFCQTRPCPLNCDVSPGQRGGAVEQPLRRVRFLQVFNKSVWNIGKSFSDFAHQRLLIKSCIFPNSDSRGRARKRGKLM